jgi:hypothetical protein
MDDSANPESNAGLTVIPIIILLHIASVPLCEMPFAVFRDILEYQTTVGWVDDGIKHAL